MNIDIMISSFPQKLRYIRRVKEFSLEDVEAKTSIPLTTISKYERGEQLPGLINLAKLSFGLGVSIDFLVFKNFSTDGES